MLARTDRDHKTAKELFREQAAAYFDDLNTAADHAPYGQVFNHAEAFCVQQGRELLRNSLQDLMQDRINTLEKKWINALCEMQNEKKASRGYRP